MIAAHPWERVSGGAAGGFAARLAAAIPEIETERLRLRAPSMDDYPVYAGFQRDDRGTGLADGPPDREAWLDFCELTSSWLLRGFGPWTMEPRAGGAPLGVAVIDHEFGDPEPEVGWLVTPEAEGAGFATEGGRAALAHAFDALGFTTLVSYVDRGNARSIRVAERLGGSRDRAAERGLDGETLVFRHSPETLQ